MKRISGLIALILAMTSQVTMAQTPHSTHSFSAKVHTPLVFSIPLSPPQWEASDKTQEVDNFVSASSPSLVFLQENNKFYCWGPVGEYTLSGNLLIVNWTKQEFFRQRYTVSISITPAANPTPNPPAPTDSPFPSGFYCLIVEEQNSRNSLTPAQREILSSAAIRDYLDTKYTGWRLLDKNTPIFSASPWKKALEEWKKTNSGDFGLVISSPTRWEMYKFPENEEATLTLLRSFVQ